jgi:hypothetical protein
MRHVIVDHGWTRHRGATDLTALRAVVTLDVGSGRQSGFWSDEFIQRVFPVEQRTRAMTKELRF